MCDWETIRSTFRHGKRCTRLTNHKAKSGPRVLTLVLVDVLYLSQSPQASMVAEWNTTRKRFGQPTGEEKQKEGLRPARSTSNLHGPNCTHNLPSETRALGALATWLITGQALALLHNVNIVHDQALKIPSSARVQSMELHWIGEKGSSQCVGARPRITHKGRRRPIL